MQAQLMAQNPTELHRVQTLHGPLYPAQTGCSQR
jgi:hypothetical protein